MALKAGRVGVAPSQVDEFGIIQGGGPSGDAYTKQESDAKFLAKTDAQSTYATKAAVNALMADNIAYDGTDSGLAATDVQEAVDELAAGKVNAIEGTYDTDKEYVTVDSLGYDETNQCLILKVDGADTVIPFSKGSSGAPVAVGNVSWSNATDVKVTLDFKPKYLAVLEVSSGTPSHSICYNEDVATNKQYFASNTGGTWEALPSTASVRIKTIDNDGFTLVKNNTTNKIAYYFAIGTVPSSQLSMLAPSPELMSSDIEEGAELMDTDNIRKETI